ncbi:MAG: hypothetical protein DCC49_00300 [Acidobacteria bacterium]|nr:MAG: hypothetical protein DCC49_00300 [Acidobacteriota bacterium]
MRVTLEQVDRKALKELLVKNWMTHDAMWFMNAVGTMGIETANSMNRSSVRMMAGVEAKRIRKLMGVDSVGDISTLRDFFETARELVIGDFIDFTWEWHASSFDFEITKCFAFDGVSKLGVAGEYECGIYERIYGWLEALGVEYEVSPQVDHCTMFHGGECKRTFRVSF